MVEDNSFYKWNKELRSNEILIVGKEQESEGYKLRKKYSKK